MLRGKWLAELVNQRGEVLKREQGSNVITTGAGIIIASALAGDGNNEITHAAIGTDATTPAYSQLTLQGTELARVAITSKVASSENLTVKALFPAGTGTGTIEEAGLFDASSLGNMFCRWLTTTFVKSATDAFSITWTVEIDS